MERKISLSDVQKAVNDAFENYKSIKDGQADQRFQAERADAFGISVVLTDGTVINKGDTQMASPLGDIAKIPEHVVLLTQNSVDELARKAGACTCHKDKKAKPEIPVSPHGVKAMSVIVPQNDPEGKWDIVMSSVINLMGSAPVLADKLYEDLQAEVATADTINKIALAQFSLYDDANIAVNLYTKLISMTATTEQLATMGATIAADGYNPVTKQNVFDGKISAPVTSIIARKGPKHEGRQWMLRVGLPAKSSFGGAIVALMPGFGAIAAYAPQLDENGVSVRAAKAIEYIANTLQLNVYASARVNVEG